MWSRWPPMPEPTIPTQRKPREVECPASLIDVVADSHDVPEADRVRLGARLLAFSMRQPVTGAELVVRAVSR